MHVRFEDINETTMFIDAEYSVLLELANNFSFKVPNAQFMPIVKSGVWDGVVRLINSGLGTTYKGLLPHLIKFCRSLDYDVSVDKRLREQYAVDKNWEYDWDALKLPDYIDVRDFQKRAVNLCVQNKRKLIESSTGSGKSLIIYAAIRELEKRLPDDQKILLIVPGTHLVAQMAGDFEEYAQNVDWCADENCHQIYEGQSHKTDKKIVISTWQSIYKKQAKWFEQFGAVFGDEVHEFEAKSTKSIMEKSTNAEYRAGFTGTLKEAKTHIMTLTGLFGPSTKVSDTQDLIDRGILSKMTVHGIVLKYKGDQLDPIRPLSSLKYPDEIDYITDHSKRRRLVSKTCKGLPGNTLVLFERVKKHGIPQYEDIKKIAGNKKVYIIYGGVGTSDRVKIQKIAEKETDVVICASYGTFQRGINIKNIDHVMLGSPTASRVRLLQSIGRGLRKKNDDSHLHVWDIADDLRDGNSTFNHTLKHFMKRHDIYVESRFNFKLKTHVI